jgi:hypothetical protein
MSGDGTAFAVTMILHIGGWQERMLRWAFGLEEKMKGRRRSLWAIAALPAIEDPKNEGKEEK